MRARHLAISLADAALESPLGARAAAREVARTPFLQGQEQEPEPSIIACSVVGTDPTEPREVAERLRRSFESERAPQWRLLAVGPNCGPVGAVSRERARASTAARRARAAPAVQCRPQNSRREARLVPQARVGVRVLAGLGRRARDGFAQPEHPRPLPRCVLDIETVTREKSKRPAHRAMESNRILFIMGA